MAVKSRVLMLAVILLAVSGAFMLSLPTARGSGEPENPFWSVAGKRLGMGSTKKVSVINAPSEATILYGKIGTKEVEVHCGTTEMSSTNLEGSTEKHDGKISGTLELSVCKLSAREKSTEAYKEQPECEVPTIKSVTLAGALWLEGTKTAGGATTAVVFEPKTLTEEKKEIAKVEIKNKGTEKCSLGGTDLMEGEFAADLRPQNEEFTYLRWAMPNPAITAVWRPASEEGEETLGLKFGGNAATMQGLLQAENGTEKYGGGTLPIAGIEAPYWKVHGERLGVGVEKEVESGELDPEPATIKTTVKGKEVEIRCSKMVLKEARLLGTNIQLDAKFLVKKIEFSQCKVFIGGTENTKCTVEVVNTSHLSGRVWFEGTKGERKTKQLMIFEPEGNLAEPTISGSECPVAERLEIAGPLAMRMSPESIETENIKFSSPGISGVHGWQSAHQEGEIIVEQKHECHEVIIKIPEFPVKLKEGGNFSVGE
jgi:hypothetical protein